VGKRMGLLGVKKSDLPILKWAREKGCPWDLSTCNKAAMNGHFDVLNWARENGAPWNLAVCNWAATNADLPMLKWAREQGCPWNRATLELAAEKGSKEHRILLKWALLNGKWDASDLQSVSQNG